jgi:hypothetical protein
MSHAKISTELATFLESGLSIVVATRDRDLQPDGAVAWAARVHPDGGRLTVYLHEMAAREMLRNLEQHPGIALDFDLPTSHRACQVKGNYLSSRRAREDEREIVNRQIDGFAADLEGIGIPRNLTEVAWQLWPCMALEVEVTDLFEQTPGPGTGERLK